MMNENNDQLLLKTLIVTILFFLTSSISYSSPVPKDDVLFSSQCHYSDPLYNIPRLWGFMSVFDFDEHRTKPAIIDVGIVDVGSVKEGGERCDVTAKPTRFFDAEFDCRTSSFGGEYNGVLVGLNDAYKRHGSKMTNYIAATHGDGGFAGIAGQVAVPHLYRFEEVDNYLFELDTTIDRAVAQGATSINISGGYPCKLRGTSESYNICTVSGRIRASLEICPIAGAGTAIIAGACDGPNPIPSICEASISAAALVCSTLLTVGLIEGDIQEYIETSIGQASSKGVPIVASAGNVLASASNGSEPSDRMMDLAGLLTGAVVPTADTLEFGILPATVSDVISVGAVSSDKPYINTDFHGSDVDIWAPSNDTSPAAAFVSGLISLAQAINPQLHRDTADLPNLIPNRLRTLLRDTAYTNDKLNGFGHRDETNTRGLLVNPYEFIVAAADDVIPDFRSLGYSEDFDSWVSSDAEDADGPPKYCRTVRKELDEQDVGYKDRIASAMQLDRYDIPNSSDATKVIVAREDHDVLVKGAIVKHTGRYDYVDIDNYQLSLEQLSSNSTYITELELRYLDGFGDIELHDVYKLLKKVSETVDGSEKIVTYHTPKQFQGANLTFSVKGKTANDDNLYKVALRVIESANVAEDNSDQIANPNNDQIQNATFLQADPVLFMNINDPVIERYTIIGNIHTKSDRDWYMIKPTVNESLASNLTVSIENKNSLLQTRVNPEDEIATDTPGVFYLRIKPTYEELGLALEYEIKVKVNHIEPIRLGIDPDRVRDAIINSAEPILIVEPILSPEINTDSITNQTGN